MNDFNGIINIYKPRGMTSHDVVQRARKILKIRRIGHTGTLDPDADGVLLLCIGGATRISIFLNDLEKGYRATMMMGSRTNTQDASGTVLEESPVPTLTETDIEKALNSFVGESFQIPPIYSAIKKNGVPLYSLARKGVSVEREPRKINIYTLKMLSFSSPHISFELTCSSGTYIRTLCEDLGTKLGTLGHLKTLTRTSIGSFSIDNSLPLDCLNTARDFIIPMDKALSHYPKAVIMPQAIFKAINGAPVPSTCVKISSKKSAYYRLYTYDHEFFGIGEMASAPPPIEFQLRIKKILKDQNKLFSKNIVA